MIGVDQEGGSVSHLEGITTGAAGFAVDGQAVANRATGAGAVQALATATGLELRDLGFTWDFAPVADVTIGAADVTIGDRSASSDPQVAARTVTAAVDGFNAAGVVSTLKHFPGHGRATVDSHQELPQIDASMADLRASDLVPFVAGIKAGRRRSWSATSTSPRSRRACPPAWRRRPTPCFATGWGSRSRDHRLAGHGRGDQSRPARG